MFSGSFHLIRRIIHQFVVGALQVLKTRDYIHVEQVAPFGDINIKPRVMLMKSDL